MSKSKLFVAAALALTGALGVGAAQARDADVQWSVTIGTPIYSQPMPVYHRPVYTRPAPVYVQPAPVYHHGGYGYREPTRWDRDGDGIPNRRDGLYNPRWDRDGDGIPNRHDRYSNTRHDRDGDGIPNRYDRNDGWRR
jgi:hypothetical protein